MYAENFFVEDEFYNDIEDYLIARDLEMEDIEKLPDDYKVEIMLSKLEPIFQLKRDWVIGVVVGATDTFDDRFPEENEHIFKQIENAVNLSIDIDKLNSLLPSLYYPGGEDSFLTKQDLIDASN
jgi:hypothetical protein